MNHIAKGTVFILRPVYNDETIALQALRDLSEDDFYVVCGTVLGNDQYVSILESLGIATSAVLPEVWLFKNNPTIWNAS